MARLNYIKNLIDIVTTATSDNCQFVYYGHLVEMQSCMRGFFAATIYRTKDRYEGELATFSFDYWRKHLYIEQSDSTPPTEAITSAFRGIYGNNLTIAIDTT